MASRSSLTNDGGTEYPFIRLSGPQQRLSQTLEDISRPGVDGSSFRRMGERAAPFDVVGEVDCTDASDAVSKMVIYAAMQGTLVTFKDDHAQTHSNVVCLGVRKEDQQKCVLMTGGVNGTGKTVLLTVRFTLQLTA